MNSDSDNGRVLTVDIGGTKINVALVDADNTVTGLSTASTPSREDGAAVVRQVLRVARRVLDADDGPAPTRVGIGSAGVVSPDGRRITSATDAIRGWAGTELATDVEAELGIPCTVINDVHAHALGELAGGVGRGHDSMLMVAVGTGIGGAVIVGGRLVPGVHGVAGHIGQIRVTTTAPENCAGYTDTLENLASGPGMTAFYTRLGGRGVGNGHQLHAATRTDPLAADIITAAGSTTGHTIASLVNALDPGLVVLGGGVTRMGDTWWGPLEEAYARTLMPPLRDTPLVAAELGDDAALVGAAHHARTHLNP
ncbi:ROK family protein [Corynebacterium sp. P7003]|uniref:ROK family protein n=1 Tax=Corynebacterium pygosceleis TaxID=2800406 RepID=A0ABT3WSK4_9CORY|nr:ROK family protein [Corynebacterium pygosceleis]MCX7445212.1 ROK family protein [Corynebacterium pygosceleis]